MNGQADNSYLQFSHTAYPGKWPTPRSSDRHLSHICSIDSMLHRLQMLLQQTAATGLSKHANETEYCGLSQSALLIHSATFQSHFVTNVKNILQNN